MFFFFVFFVSRKYRFSVYAFVRELAFGGHIDPIWKSLHIIIIIIRYQNSEIYCPVCATRKSWSSFVHGTLHLLVLFGRRSSRNFRLINFLVVVVRLEEAFQGQAPLCNCHVTWLTLFWTFILSCWTPGLRSATDVTHLVFWMAKPKKYTKQKKGGWGIGTTYLSAKYYPSYLRSILDVICRHHAPRSIILSHKKLAELPCSYASYTWLAGRLVSLRAVNNNCCLPEPRAASPSIVHWSIPTPIVCPPYIKKKEEG